MCLSGYWSMFHTECWSVGLSECLSMGRSMLLSVCWSELPSVCHPVGNQHGSHSGSVSF